MTQPEDAREVHPWGRTFRNSDNATGPDFRPQFVRPDMPFAEELDGTPYGGLTTEGEGASGGDLGDGADPKDSTVQVFVVSSPQTESSRKGASQRITEETPVTVDTGVPGVEASDN